jgi:hypothetical protein
MGNEGAFGGADEAEHKCYMIAASAAKWDEGRPVASSGSKAPPGLFLFG